MTDEGRRRIPIVDKRVSSRSTPAAESASASSAPDASPFGLGVDGAAAADPAPSPPSADAQAPEQQAGPAAADDAGPAEGGGEEQKDFLDDLRRLQADFDNYRKRMMREQAATSTRAKARLMEQLLPVLDDFERALEHEDSSATELLYKQLRSTLEAEGLEEIEAEGKPFDPNVHDAIDSREDPGVSEIVVRSVFRRGYKVGEQVLRAAMVVVARPPEPQDPQNEDEQGRAAGNEPADEE